MVENGNDEEPSVDRRGFLRLSAGAGATATTVALPGSTERLGNVEGVETGERGEERETENPKVMHNPETGTLEVDGRETETTVLGADEDVATVPVDAEAGIDAVESLKTDDWHVHVAPNLETKAELERQYGDEFGPDPDDDMASAVEVITGVPEDAEEGRLDRLKPGEGVEIRAPNELQAISRIEAGTVERELEENEGLFDKLVDGWLARDGMERPIGWATAAVAVPSVAGDRVRSALGVSTADDRERDQPGAAEPEPETGVDRGDGAGVRDLPQGDIEIERADIERDEGAERGRRG